MKKWSPMQRVLTGALAIALAGWVVDATLRAGAPQSARGASQQEAPQPAPAACAQDVTQLVERLLSGKYNPVACDLEELQRDLFVPSPLMRAATAPEAPPGPEKEPQDESAAALDFASRHVLTGVIIGQTPLAQVDGQLVPLGAVLDGHELVEIERDFVVFESGESRVLVTLLIKPRSSLANRAP